MNRKLSVGEALGEVFSIYGANAGTLLPIAFWLFLVVSIVNGIADGSIGLVFLATILTFVAAMLYQGMVVSLVRDVQDGQLDSSVGQLFESVTPVLAALIGASIIYGIAVGIGFFLLIIPGCILVTIWAVIAPAIVIERRGVIEAFGRSRELVRGNGWPVFGTVIVAALIAFITSLILTAIADALANGAILRIVFSALASTVTAPIGALVAGVLYYRLLEIGGQAEPGQPGPEASPSDFTPPPPPPPPPPAGPGATA